MAPALPHRRTTVSFLKPFSCGGPEIAPALPQRRTTVSFLKLFSCGGLEMAPALPQAADNRSAYTPSP